MRLPSSRGNRQLVKHTKPLFCEFMAAPKKVEGCENDEKDLAVSWILFNTVREGAP